MTAYNDEATIRQVHDEVIAALNAFDPDKFLSLYSDEIVLIEPDMPTINGKAAVIQLFKKFQQQKLVHKLSYTIQKLEVFGKTAFVRVQVIKQITQTNETKEAGKFITLSKKQADGRWLLHAIVNNDQSNFSFFETHFRNGEPITKANVAGERFLEKSTKDVSESGRGNLVYQTILSTVNVLHNNSIAGQKLLKIDPRFKKPEISIAQKQLRIQSTKNKNNDNPQ